MGYVTLYTFGMFGSQYQVIRSDTDPTYINYNVYSGSAPTRPPDGTQIAAPFCSGVDKYIYRAKSSIPYAYYELIPNDPYCGYTPPSCDIIEADFEVTDETGVDANDCTVNLFATSSRPITYYLFNYDLSVNLTNTTGYFIDLPPDTYIIRAQDTIGCSVQEVAYVLPYDDTSVTHWKYRHQFQSVDGLIEWDLRLYDMRNNYDITQYPKDIDCTDGSVVMSKINQDEDKIAPIVSTSLAINLWNTGATFSTDEFNQAPEKQWYVELYNNCEIEFKGYVLPDEVQDLYADPSYEFVLTATDGIPSLKGNSWGDGSGGNGYSTAQIPQYALKTWCNMVKQCLDQLGYIYGNITIASSLRYNNTYNANLWYEIGTWTDLLYESDGTPVKTYDALERLLRGMKLTLIQHKGRFVLVNWSDLSYLLNGIKASEFNLAFYEINLATGVVATGAMVTKPLFQQVGYEQLIRPINPVQSLNKDKAYNIKAAIDFNILSLLYPNPSFEIGAVEWLLPSGWEKHSPNNGFLTNISTAYDGNWVFRHQGYSTFLPSEWDLIQANTIQTGINNGINYIRFTDGWVVDQDNKTFKVSFMWRPSKYSDDENGVPNVGLQLVGASGTNWFYFPQRNAWEHYDPAFSFSSPIGSQRITDYNAWNSYSVSTVAFPERGTVYLNLLGAARVDEGGYADQNTVIKTIDYDQLEVTFGDGSDSYSKQIGETHTTTAVTGVPMANTKEIDLPLFTYPNNKRMAGNIFTDTPYVDGQVANLWSYALNTLNTPDRLPATITKSVSRSYSRPMYIFEGDVKANYISFYGIFQLKYYESAIFMPYSIELDLRNCTGHIVLIETSDDEAQNIYQYKGKFEKNAKRNN